MGNEHDDDKELTLSHIAVACHRALFPCCLRGASCRQTHLPVQTITNFFGKLYFLGSYISYQTDAFLQLCVPVQFEQGDVVVKGLAVVVVVDVGGGHPEGLGSRTAKLLGQVMVANPHINCVACSHNAGKIKKIATNWL